MKLKPPTPTPKARVEIIPLIDVVFFLLATFVLVSLSMTRLQGIKLDMPASRTSAESEESEVKKVAILKSGQFAWDGQTLSWNQLIAKVTQYRRESPDPRILIIGEESADFGLAVSVLDEVRHQGISRVSIQTKIQPIVLD